MGLPNIDTTSGTDDARITFGPIGIRGSPRAVRLVVGILMLSIPLYIAYSFAPLIDRQATIDRAVNSPEAEQFTKSQMSIDRGEIGKPIEFFTTPVSELLELSVPMEFLFKGVAPKINRDQALFRIRYDRVILWAGIATIVALTLRVLLQTASELRLGSLALRLAPTSGASPAAPGRGPLSAIKLFELEVQGAERRAEILFSRSTLLLAGGIIMAFVGVGTFYVTLPEGTKDEAITSYWPHLIRPTGVLVFVESIAWFLLRQYRALIEDYKWFHQLYMKRANYLAALRILDKQTVRPEDHFVAASLIQEDFTSKLKKGETTESLEKLKLPEDSPVTEILRAIRSLRDDKHSKSVPKPKHEGES